MTGIVVHLRCTSCDVGADSPLGCGTLLSTLCDCNEPADWVISKLFVGKYEVSGWGAVDDDDKNIRVADLLKAVEEFFSDETVNRSHGRKTAEGT